MIHPANSLRYRTRGRWFAVLSMLGVDTSYLRNKHGPCPVCGGTDRFRWDDKNGDGTFYCNQCGPGSGIDLVMRIRGLSFREAALLVEGVIDDHPSLFPGRGFSVPRPVRSEASIRDGLNALWRSGEPVRIGGCWPRCIECREPHPRPLPEMLHARLSAPAPHEGLLLCKLGRLVSIASA